MIVNRGPARWRIPAGLTAIALLVLALATAIIRGQASPVVRTIEMDQTVDDVAMDTSSSRVFIDTSHGNDTAMRVLDTRTGMLVRTIPDPWAWAPSWLRRRIPFAPPSSRTRIIPSSVSILDTTR